MWRKDNEITKEKSGSACDGGMTVFVDTYAAGTTVISSGQEFASYASSNSIEKCDV